MARSVRFALALVPSACVLGWARGGGGRTDWARRPGLLDVEVVPAQARPGDLLACRWTFVSSRPGAEDDSTVAWWVGDERVGTGPTLDTSGLAVGDDVWCEVTPVDGWRVGAPADAVARLPGNVVLIVADDVGVDRIAALGSGAEPARTPTLDRLAASGVVFDHAWAEPTCSPGRAAFLTGRDPSQTGIGRAISAFAGTFLHLEERTLPEVLAQETDGLYDAALIGKWHLGVHALGEGYRTHPNDQGFPHFAGMLMGFSDGEIGDDLPSNYYSWLETTDGVAARVEDYNTTVSIDRAVTSFDTMQEPFLLVIASPAAHAPYQAPPADLVAGPPPGTTSARRHQNAVIEALDTEIGRFLATVDPARLARTTVFVSADNGTPSGLLTDPFPPALGKGTLAEGGLRVPLIVSGLGVSRAGERSDHPVQATDVFATIVDLAGISLDDGIERDAIAFTEALDDPAAPPARDVGFAEQFGNARHDCHEVAARADGYKLVRWWAGEALFDLRTTPAEAKDLLEAPLDADAQAAYDHLSAWLDARPPLPPP